ncbi:MAG: amidohydrolase family protein [Myxococcota bacterium]|jgi:predicted TIM-barrel fold metal-dependent hydrolase|nr:amidohydrolase family protein [Myxococcota bacterium]
MRNKKDSGRGWIVAAVLGALLVAGLLLARQQSAPPTPTASPASARGAAATPGKPDLPDDPRLTIETLPPRRFKVINDHEHILDEAQALRVLAAMDQLGIEKMALMGTSKYTFTLNNKYGFEEFRENNEEILRIAKKYPTRFLAFPTIRPLDEGNLELMKDYIARGAAGLKLYLGHGASTGKEPFHLMPLDDPRLRPIYQYLQDNQIPISYHVNLTKYYDEFVRMMEQFPYLRVCLLHFGLYKNTPARLKALGALLERYPNVYSDISFGWRDFQIEGFTKFNKHPKRYRDFLTRYQDRFMYASDMVVEPMKDEAYIINTLRSYMQVLEMDRYRFFLEPKKPWRGLKLPDTVLRAIYEETPRRFHLLDAQGRPPDRSKGWPWPGWEAHTSMPGLPPTVAVVQPLPPGTKVVGRPPASTSGPVATPPGAGPGN